MTFGEILKQKWKPYYSYFHDFYINKYAFIGSLGK